MFSIIGAALLLGASPGTSVTDAVAGQHRITINHRGAPVDVTYEGAVKVVHRQIGGVAPPGRAQFMRCTWRADVTIRRRAVSTAGIVASREMLADVPLTGSRPGWCSGQRKAIAADVTRHRDAVQAHIVAAAAADQVALLAELDLAHDRRRG